MDANKVTNDQWNACGTGEVQQLVGRLQTRRRMRTARRAGAAAAGLLLLLSAGYFLADGSSKTVPNAGVPDHEINGIVCSEVLEHAEEYMAGTLDDDLQARIRGHLKSCAYCRERIETMRRDGAPAVGFHLHRSERGPAEHRLLALSADF